MPWNKFSMIRVIWQLPESFEVPVSHMTSILEEEGPPHQNLKQNKFVLKWFLDNFKCFNIMFRFKKKTEIGPMQTPTTYLYGISQ